MKRLLLILGLCGTLGAQTTTTITGTIKDLTQALVTSGKVTFTLQPSKDTTISGLARFSPAQVVCLINASGLIKAQDGTSVCTVSMNTALQPTGTYYRVDIWPYGVKTSSFTFYAVLSSYDWSTVVPTPTTSPAQNFVDIFSNQTIGGAKTWSGAQTYSALNTFSGGAAFPGGISGSVAHAGAETFNGVTSFPGGISGSTAFGGPTSFGGATTFTGPGSFTNAGVFTNTQTNEYLQSLVGTCTTAEYNTVQTGNFTTDAMAGCVDMPITATVHQINGIAGYVTNHVNVSQSGGAVGGYFQGRQLANNGSSWGINGLVQDVGGLTGHQLISNELDINVLGTPARAWGILINGASTGTIPALGSAAGIEIRGPASAIAGSQRWPAALNIIDSTATVAINIGTVASGNSQNSQPIQLQGRDSGGVTRNLSISSSPGGALTVNALTVATLPSASANPGGIAYVTDSTAVAAEGQTCAGSSSNKALAFSNGTVWKCF